MGTNRTTVRLARADRTTRLHARAARLERKDLAVQACGLITDVLHLARANGYDWRAVVAAAITHHASESIEPAERPNGEEWQGGVVHELAEGLRRRRSDSEHPTDGNVIPLFTPRRAHDFHPPAA
jgi:hypothetical protein